MIAMLVHLVSYLYSVEPFSSIAFIVHLPGLDVGLYYTMTKTAGKNATAEVICLDVAL